jgi:GH25 family lysozyme M1 (1,4-beta-N-acetylmuramidase)
MKIFKALKFRGIDISVFNFFSGHIPTKEELMLAINMGIMFISIRVGYGRVIDALFKVVWWIFKQLGMKRFPYWYLDYYSHKKLGIDPAAWGKEQAENAWRVLKDDPGEGPLACDMEEASKNVGAWPINLLTRKEYNIIARAFCEHFTKISGRKVIIYCSIGFLDQLYDWAKDYDLWVAWYNHTVTKATIEAAMAKRKWRGRARFHQYDRDGNTDGDGKKRGKEFGFDVVNLDLNEALMTEAEWDAYWKGHQVTSEDQTLLDLNVLFLLDVKISNLSVRIGPGKSFRAIRNSGKGLFKVYETKRPLGEAYDFVRISQTHDEWVSMDPKYSKAIPK